MIIVDMAYIYIYAPFVMCYAKYNVQNNFDDKYVCSISIHMTRPHTHHRSPLIVCDSLSD